MQGGQPGGIPAGLSPAGQRGEPLNAASLLRNRAILPPSGVRAQGAVPLGTAPLTPPCSEAKSLLSVYWYLPITTLKIFRPFIPRKFQCGFALYPVYLDKISGVEFGNSFVEKILESNGA